MKRPDATLRGWVVNSDKPDPILYFGGNAERIELNREAFAHAGCSLRVGDGFQQLRGPRRVDPSADLIGTVEIAAHPIAGDTPGFAGDIRPEPEPAGRVHGETDVAHPRTMATRRHRGPQLHCGRHPPHEGHEVGA